MQQHLMQMQPMMAAYYPNNVTSDHIQQYLDENKSLILKIVESQNSGKLSECAENQARLQRNLMYLAAIADSQPQPPAVHSQYSSSGIMQAGGHNYTQHQQAQQMTQQSLMAARSSMLYTQQPFSALHQQQQAAAALHSHQLGMSSSGSSGLHMMQNEPNNGGGGNGPLGSGGGFPDFGLGTSGGGKHDLGLSGSGERRGGSSGGHNDDHGGENLYLKGGDDN